MKRTFTANINGLIFHIDEDAYDRLQEYMRSIKTHFANQDGTDEIASDIESRIAELMQLLITPQKQVITIEGVESIIKQLGEPQEMSEEETPNKEEKEKKQTYSNIGKRFFRDPDNKVVSGVCSGIAAYFNIDPVIIRILFVVFFLIGGSSFWVYVVLWIAIPEAQTSVEKLQMKGEQVNIDNIEKKIKEEFKGIGKRMKSYGSEASDAIHKATSKVHPKTGIERFFSFIFDIFGHVFKALGIVFGVVFIIVGIFILVGFIFSFFPVENTVFISSMGLTSFSIPQVIDAFIDNASEKSLFIAGLLLTIGVPLIMLIYNGMKLIFGWRFEVRFLGLSTFSIWLAGLIFLGIVVFRTANDFSKKGVEINSVKMDNPIGNTIYLKALSNQKMNEITANNSNYYTGRWNIVNTKEDQLLYGIPEITILQGETNLFELSISKFAKGRSLKLANQRAKDINFEYLQVSDTLFISPYYLLKENSIWRNQYLKITIKVPKGKYIYLDESLTPIIGVDKQNEELNQFIGRRIVLSSNSNFSIAEDVSQFVNDSIIK